LERGIPITSKMIKYKALSLSKHPDFCASKGWLEKIKKKYNMKVQRGSKKNEKEEEIDSSLSNEEVLKFLNNNLNGNK
jgi:hypothetical protein